jgi:hypothetical protein
MPQGRRCIEECVKIRRDCMIDVAGKLAVAEDLATRLCTEVRQSPRNACVVMLLYFCVPLLSTQCRDYAAAARYCEASVQRVCKRFGATSIEAGPEYAKLAQLHHLNGQVRDGGLSSSPCHCHCASLRGMVCAGQQRQSCCKAWSTVLTPCAGVTCEGHPCTEGTNVNDHCVLLQCLKLVNASWLSPWPGSESV